MSNLSTNTYILELCVSALHRGHAKYFNSLMCHQNRGHATLLQTKKTVTRAVQKFSAKRKNVQLITCRRESRHSCARTPIICGRLFRDIRTFERAVEGSSVSPLSKAPVLPRRKSSAMRRLYCSTRCARRSTSLASVFGASTLLAREGVLGRGRASSSLFLQLQCCFQRSHKGESDRVQAEHDARPAFLALDFLARLDSAVRAPPAAPARSSPRCSPITTSTPQRVLVPAPLVAVRLRRNATHTCTYGFEF